MIGPKINPTCQEPENSGITRGSDRIGTRVAGRARAAGADTAREDAEHQHHHEDRPDRVDAVPGQEGQDERRQTLPDEADGHDDPAIETVGDGTGQRCQNGHRQELDQTQQAQVELPMGHVEDLCSECDLLGHGGHGHGRAGPQEHHE